MVDSYMTAILFPISCCPISSQCCVLLTSSASQCFPFSRFYQASLSAKCYCSTTLSAPTTSPKPVYSYITLSLFNAVKGYMLCIYPVVCLIRT